MKRMFRFGRKAIDALPPCPADSKSKEVEYSDQELTGLRLQVNRLGRKSFLYRYIFQGRKRAMAIGPYPAVSVEDARERVIEWRALLVKGIDPQSKREEEAGSRITFRQFYEQHLVPHIRATKRSHKEDESRARNHILPVFGDRAMMEISTLEIQRFHDRKKAELCAATANRIFEVIRRAYNLAILWGLLPPMANAPRGIRLHVENNRRERYLSLDELRRFMVALDATPNQTVADALRLLLATGCRRNEILKLRFDQLRLERRELFLPHPKGKRGRHVVLNDVAMEILERRKPVAGNPFVFPGKIAGRPIDNPTRVWRNVLLDAGIDPKTTTIHSLRHTHASYLVGRASLQEIAGILGHASTTMTERYAHLDSSRLREVSNHVALLMKAAQSGEVLQAAEP